MNENILNEIKQRYPFILVDRVLECKPGKSIKVLKLVTVNEPCFRGHFPKMPIFPGVYVIEACAQAASILFLKSSEQSLEEDEIMVLGTVNDMRFLKPVFPGDCLQIHVSIIKILGKMAMTEVLVLNEAVEVAKGKLSFSRINGGLYEG